MSRLDTLKIASPCPADWDAMTGDDRVRHCSECRLSVYNLSEMTREEAEALIEETEGRLCVRLYQRADGTVITRDCPVGAGKKKRRAAFIGAVLGGLMTLLAGAGALWARSSQCSSPYARHAGLTSMEPFKTLSRWFPQTFTPQPRPLMGAAVMTTPNPNANPNTQNPTSNPAGIP